MNNDGPRVDEDLFPRSSFLIRFSATGGDILLHKNFSLNYRGPLALTAIVLFVVFLSIGIGSVPFTGFSLPLPTGSVPFIVLAFVYLAAAPVQIYWGALRNTVNGPGSSDRDDSGEPIIQRWLPFFSEATTRRFMEPFILAAIGTGLILIWYPTVSLGVGVWLIIMSIAMFVREGIRPWRPKDLSLPVPQKVTWVSNPVGVTRGDPVDGLPDGYRELMEPDHGNK